MTDSEGLHEVANTSNPLRRADVVFVHGLGGGSHSTWRHSSPEKQDHFFWPAELGADLPECGVWTVGYPAGVGALGAPGMIMEKRAGNLTQKLANAGFGHRPILFVTHSMGGLVVKSLLVGSQVQADKDRKIIAKLTGGIVFCATPHRGSDFATAARRFGAFLGGAQDHLQEMQAGKEPLDILHDQFLEWQRIRRVAVCSYAENRALFRGNFLQRLISPFDELVVPRDSANPNIAGHTVRDVDDDHLSIVKPRNRKSDVYAGVLRFLRECLDANVSAPSAPAPHVPPVTEPTSASGAGDMRQALNALTPTQRRLVRTVAAHSAGVHVTDLAEMLEMKRNETVYRVRELVGQGVLQTSFFTDLLVLPSELLTEFMQSSVDALKEPGAP